MDERKLGRYVTRENLWLHAAPHTGPVFYQFLVVNFILGVLAVLRVHPHLGGGLHLHSGHCHREAAWTLRPRRRRSEQR